MSATELPKLTVGPVLGKITESSARILIEADRAATVKLVIDGRSIALRTLANVPVIVAVDGLPANKSISFRFEGFSNPEDTCGVIRTFSPLRNRLYVATVSCNYLSRRTKTDLWASLAARAESIDVLIHIGDQIYADDVFNEAMALLKSRIPDLPADGGETEERDYYSLMTEEFKGEIANMYRGLYRTVYSHPPTRYIMSQVCNLMIWDDHEIRDDWGSQPGDSSPTSPQYAIALIGRRVMWEYQRQLWDNIDTLDDAYRGHEAHSHLFNGGRFGILFLDQRGARSFAHDDRLPYLGADQWMDVYRSLGIPMEQEICDTLNFNTHPVVQRVLNRPRDESDSAPPTPSEPSSSTPASPPSGIPPQALTTIAVASGGQRSSSSLSSGIRSFPSRPTSAIGGGPSSSTGSRRSDAYYSMNRYSAIIDAPATPAPVNAMPSLKTVESLIVVTSVPLVFVGHEYTNKLASLNPELDDFKDQWSFGDHVREQVALLDTISAWRSPAASPSGKQRGIIVVGGDVHVGGYCEISSSSSRASAIPQLITSAVTNEPPSWAVSGALKVLMSLENTINDSENVVRYRFQHQKIMNRRNYGVIQMSVSPTETETKLEQQIVPPVAKVTVLKDSVKEASGNAKTTSSYSALFRIVKGSRVKSASWSYRTGSSLIQSELVHERTTCDRYCSAFNSCLVCVS